MDPAARRVSLLVATLIAYVAVTAVFVVFERPGLGLGHFFYIPIVLTAFVGGPVIGACGGLVATALYTGGIIVNPHLPSNLEYEQTAIRLVTFVAIGGLIGWYTKRNRALVAQLSQLANRDSVTGLPNTRAFQTAIELRLEREEPFVLLIGDVDELRQINVEGREAGDDALRRLADRLIAAKRPDDDVARVGGDEFAILGPLGASDGKTLALGLEQHLSFGGDSVTFGWATYPQDSDNALGLYRAADERLYARKVARGFRRGPPRNTVVTPP